MSRSSSSPKSPPIRLGSPTVITSPVDTEYDVAAATGVGGAAEAAVAAAAAAAAAAATAAAAALTFFDFVVDEEPAVEEPGSFLTSGVLGEPLDILRLRRFVGVRVSAAAAAAAGVGVD